MFGFGGQEFIETAAGYTNLTFAVFAHGCLLVLLGFSSSSLSTGDCTNKYTVDLGAAR